MLPPCLSLSGLLLLRKGNTLVATEDQPRFNPQLGLGPLRRVGAILLQQERDSEWKVKEVIVKEREKDGEEKEDEY